MSLSYSDKWDRRISWALMWSFIANAFNYMVKSVFPISGALWNMISVIVAVSILLAYVICLREVLRRASRVFWWSIFVFAVLYLMSIVLCSSRGEPINLVLETARSTYLLFIPAGVFAVAVNNKRNLYEVALKASYLLSAMMLFRMFANYNPLYTDDEGVEYSMSFGYILIVPVLLHIHEYLRTRRKLLLFLSIVEVISILVYASRGVLLSIIALIIYEAVIGIKKQGTKTVFIVLMLGATIGYSQYQDKILEGAIGALEGFGIQSRTLTMMANDAIDSDSGRNYLFEISWIMIGESPLLGWGVGGECYEFSKYLRQSDPNVACTSHNGILQAMVQLGIPLGVLLSILIIFPIFKAHKITDDYLRSLIIVYFCAYAVPCVSFSSGFLVQPQIAIYMYLYYFSNKKFRESQ